MESNRDEPEEEREYRIRITRVGTGGSSSWIITEAFWDNVVVVPSYRELAIWALTVGPWLLHLDAIRYVVRDGPHVRRDPLRKVLSTPWDFLVTVARLSFAAILGLFVQAAIVVLLVLWVMPWVRERLFRWIYRLLEPAVGDAFVFAGPGESHRASIVQAVAARIAQIGARCDSLIVVGHSQGAAVAHAALRRDSLPESVRCFVTLGSGQRKLEGLRASLENSGVFAIRAVLRWGAAVLMAVGAWTPLLASWPNVERLAVLTFVLMPLVGESQIQRRVRESISHLPDLGGRLSWVDIYASNDPVPAGVLPIAFDDVPGFHSRQVITHRSLLRDHFSYLRHPASVSELVRIATIIDEAKVVSSNTTLDHGVVGELHALRIERLNMRDAGFVGGVLLVAYLGLLASQGGWGPWTVEGLRGEASQAAIIVACLLPWHLAWRAWNRASTTKEFVGDSPTRLPNMLGTVIFLVSAHIFVLWIAWTRFRMSRAVLDMWTDHESDLTIDERSVVAEWTRFRRVSRRMARTPLT
jgi:hypothetical protein